MLPSEHQQISFLMATRPDEMVPQDHPLMKVARQVDFSFVLEETQDLYAARRGRPAYPPETLFKVLLLEVWMNLSDVQVCQQLQYNLLYRAFCEIGWNDPIPDDTTLVRFRSRLGHDRFERLFERVVTLLRQAGFISEEWAIVDGTKVVADVAVRNTLQLVREGRKRLVRELRKADPNEADTLAPLAEPLEERHYADRDQLLAAEIEQGRKLLSELPQEDVPKEVQRIEKIYRGVLDGDGTASLEDPDARWGFKKKDDPFLGYKTHAMCDEQGFVTSCKVTPGADAEQSQVDELVQKAEDVGIEAKRLAADKGYDGQSVREAARQHKMRAFIPYRSQTRIPEGFRFQTPQKLKCPKGQVVRASRHPSGGLIFLFSQRICQKCPLRSKCLSGNEKRKRIYFRPDRQTHPLGMRMAMRKRREVERVFGGVKKWHGYGRARYRSREKVGIQTCLTFTVWNLKKAAGRWAA